MKIKKSDLLNMIQEQNEVIAKLIRQVNCHHEDIIRLESVIEPEPQLVAIRSKRDIAKELLEVDLSSELTGSDLARAMLERGDKCVMIRMGARDDKQARDIGRFAIATGIDESGRFNVMSDQQPISKADFAIPINNQGEPLTASEVGL